VSNVSFFAIRVLPAHQDVEHYGEHSRQDDTGHDRNVKNHIIASDDNVTGHAEMYQPRQQQNGCADRDENDAEYDEKTDYTVHDTVLYTTSPAQSRDKNYLPY
jgi:hypothetical protein